MYKVEVNGKTIAECESEQQARETYLAQTKGEVYVSLDGKMVAWCDRETGQQCIA